MKEFRGTPGRWIAYEDAIYSDDDCPSHAVADCSCPSSCRNEDEVISNTRLMAASKDLLEALQRRVENAEQRVFEDWLTRTRPSGDASSVHWQWEQSYDFSDFLEEWEVEIAAIRKALGE